MQWIESDPESPYRLEWCNVMHTYEKEENRGLLFNVSRGIRSAAGYLPMLMLKKDGC